MAIRVEAGPSFAPVTSFVRSVNITEGPVRLGNSLKANSPASFGPKLESTPFFRVTPTVPEARVNSFNINQFRTEIKFAPPVAPEVVKPVPKVETPRFAIHDWSRPKRGRARFNTEVGRFNRIADQAWVKLNADILPQQAEVKAQLVDTTKAKIRGRNRLVRHYQLPDIRVDTLNSTQTKGKVVEQIAAKTGTQIVIERDPKTDPKMQVEVTKNIPVEKRKRIKREKKISEKEVITIVDQKDKEAFEARTTASMEAFFKAREVSSVVDGRLIAALHPDQYSYSRRLRSRRLQHRAKSDGSYAHYVRSIRNYRRQIVTTAEAESLFRQFNEANVPVEMAIKQTERRASKKEVAKVESGKEEERFTIISQ